MPTWSSARGSTFCTKSRVGLANGSNVHVIAQTSHSFASFAHKLKESHVSSVSSCTVFSLRRLQGMPGHCWNSKKAEGTLVKKLFQEHATNPATGADPQNLNLDYIKTSVYNKHPLFQQFEYKNFAQNYKRLAAEAITNLGLQGARRE